MTLARGLAPPAPALVVVAVTVAAALAGVATGLLLTGGDDAPPAAPAPAKPRIGLASGAARLPLPADWTPLRRRSTLPGLEAATAVKTPTGEAALDLRAAEDASLLPAGVEPALFAGAEPRRLGGRAVWRYALDRPRPGTGAVALVLPTTAGVVTIACSAPDTQLDRATTACEAAMGGLRLDGARAVRPGPATAATLALGPVLERLNTVRRLQRRRLAASRSPAVRANASRRIAGAYVAAAERLRPLAGGRALRLVARLGAVGRSHRALGAAERARKRRAAARAGIAIGTGEARVQVLLAQLT